MAKGASAEKAVREIRRKTRRAISPLDEERVKLEHYYTPWELERAVARFVKHYNHRRVHESLCNVTPADMYAGRQQATLKLTPERGKPRCGGRAWREGRVRFVGGTDSSARGTFACGTSHPRRDGIFAISTSLASSV